MPSKGGENWLCLEDSGFRSRGQNRGRSRRGPEFTHPSGTGPGNGGRVSVVPETPEEVLRSLQDRRATVQEANRLHRIEQCLKLYYDNRLREKTLVDFSRLQGDFEDILRIFIDAQREILEKWGLKHNFKPALLIEMQEDFEGLLEETRKKLERLLERD